MKIYLKLFKVDVQYSDQLHELRNNLKHFYLKE